MGCHFRLPCIIVKSESEAAQSCLTLPDPYYVSKMMRIHTDKKFEIWYKERYVLPPSCCLGL